jgi:4,5-dihydroxyphthalate decarboxylase
MSDYSVSLACRNYDRTQPIIRGLVRPQGVDLRVMEQVSTPAMFEGMFRGEYDASEMSLAELTYYTARGEADFIGVPVFPSRMFRHSFLFSNAASGVTAPEDLDGKRLGFPRLVQTAIVWMRGMLVDEYGLSPARTQWLYASLHHWESEELPEEVVPHDGSTVQRIRRRGGDENQDAEQAFLEGEVDVLGSTRVPAGLATGDRRVRRIFDDYRAVEAAYYRKTGIFPIMHVLTIRKAVVDQHPDLPEKLFRLFVESKDMANRWLLSDPSLSLAWKNRYIEKEQEVFGGDPWVYGLGANQATVDRFLSYCYDQGVSERRVEPTELFVPSTWDLTE